MRNRDTPDCAIRGCARAAGRSTLCAQHHRYVPFEASLALTAELMVASSKLAAKHHKRWARDVQFALDTGQAQPRAKIEPHPHWKMGMEASASLRRPATAS